MSKTAKQEFVAKLQKRLNIKNVNAVPKVDKVVVNMGIGSLVTRKWLKNFEELEKNLNKITGQKPRLIKSKQAISNFKLRVDMPVMLQVTLRRNKAQDFLKKFNELVLPRVRDFAGLSAKNFDSGANMNIGLKSYDIFPELDPDDVTIPMWLQITIVSTTTNKEHSQGLLEEMWFIFKENK